MMYLIAQTWLFLLIAWLIGMAVGFGLSRDQKSLRLRDTEEQLRDGRNRSIDMEKELEDFRARVGEMEGLPEGVRASRVAARDEMVSRIATLERERDAARGAEKRLGEETERLRNDVDGFRTRYLEARAKWDEYQAKAEALASAPAPLNLGEAQVVPDDGMRLRVVELERLLANAKGNGRADEQTKALKERIAMLESQLAAANAGKSDGEQSKLLQARIADLEKRLAASFNAAREADALKSRVGDLQDKLGEAEVALRKTIGAPKAEADPLRARLAETEAKLAEAQRGDEDLRRLRTRTAELEKALERARAQAANLEGKLASAEGSGTSGEDVGLLKARLADVEARLMTSSGASMEFESLRNRVMTLEALLHEAAKSRDEAAILRSKVAELDGRLGQAMKAAAETRPRAAESEKV
jgi:chromosome segregation ATPase